MFMHFWYNFHLKAITHPEAGDHLIMVKMLEHTVVLIMH